MVKQWQMSGFAGSEDSMERAGGYWVKHSDYLLLQAALKEALEGWEHANICEIDVEEMNANRKRIREIRSNFYLTDK